MELDIKSLIGEATAYDKKQMLEVKRPKSWLKSVSAFANGEGGALIFGISDDDCIVGLANAERDAEKISEEIKTKLDPVPVSILSRRRLTERSWCCCMYIRDRKRHIIILGTNSVLHLSAWVMNQSQQTAFN